MTHRGPFQPLPFCDSVILWAQRDAGPCRAGGSSWGSRVWRWGTRRGAAGGSLLEALHFVQAKEGAFVTG